MSFLNKLKHALVEPHHSGVGIEFNSDCIRLAAIEVKNGKIGVTHLDTEPLPAGAIEINPFKPNILSLDAVADALKQLWGRSPVKDSNVCLLLQDRAALVFHVPLDSPAARPQELMDLIRFKLKKNIPFRTEEAHLSFVSEAGVSDPSASRFWVCVIHQHVLTQYEQFLESSIGVECGLVDLSTLNMVNFAHLEMKKQNLLQEDLMFVNVNLDYITISIMQKGNLTFLRNRVLEKQNGTTEEALAEIHPTTMYYIDKLGGRNLARAFVYTVHDTEDLCSRLETELGLKPELLSVEAISGVRFDATNAAFLRRFVPLVGLLAGRRVEYL